MAALAELELFRNTLDTLKSRLPGLEHFIAHSGSLANAEGGDEAMEDDVIRYLGKVERVERDDFADEDGSGDADRERKRARVDYETQQQALRRKIGNGVEDRGRLGSTPTAGSREDTAEGDNSAAIEAAVDLEYATLGRSRATYPTSHDRGGSAPPGDDQAIDDARESIFMHSAVPLSPVLLFPDGPSLLAVAPTQSDEAVILRQGVDLLGWHHRVFHAATLAKQVSAFWALGSTRFDLCSPAWLALYFALVAVSTKLLGRQEQDMLGWTEADTSARASQWFNCCIANLYRHNFLEHHDIHALQAIAVLALTGRDAGSPSLIANLLSSGLSIAQDLGLHRLPSDAAFKSAQLTANKSVPQRAKALIDREVRKRVFWALVHTDWFSIPFRSSWILGKMQISSPLPLNATDEDLLTGEIVNRPATEYTSASWLLQYIDVGRSMCEAFEQSQNHKSEAAYQAFLKVDKHLMAIVERPPEWLKQGGRTKEMPKSYDYMRSTFLIAVHHKILCIHRPYLYKPYKGQIVEFSRKRVVQSARAILREAPLVNHNRIWTSLYHLSAAAFIIMLELFDRRGKTELEEMREEVRSAVRVMESLRETSEIAARGLSLVGPLLVEEERLRREFAAAEAAKAGSSSASQLATVPLLSSTISTSSHPILPQFTFDPSLHGASPSSFGLSPYPSSTTTPGPSHFDEAMPPNWFYDLGVEHGEQWLHSQLSGMSGTGVAANGDGPALAAADIWDGGPYLGGGGFGYGV